MKIIHVIPDLNKGGAERLCLDICRVLNDCQEHDVLLINFRPDNEYPFLTDDINRIVVPSKFIPSIIGKHHRSIGSLQSTIDDFNPDVIHVHLYESLMVVSQLIHKAHLVIHFHDNMIQFENASFRTLFNKNKITNLYEKQLLLRSLSNVNTTFITISAHTHQYAQMTLPKNSKIHTILNAIDLGRFLNVKKEETQIPEITIIGSLVHKKGHILAIETIDQLVKKGENITLNILGDGHLKHKLKDDVERMGLNKYVIFHGNVDYPEQFLARSSVYLHTAVYEPFGLAIIEAMATGTPVICTDGMGNRNIITNNEEGFFISERNPRLIAEKVSLLLNDPSLQSKFSKNCIIKSKHFGIKNYVDKLIGLYRL